MRGKDMAKKLRLRDTILLTLKEGQHTLALDLLRAAGYTKRAAQRELSYIKEELPHSGT